MTSKYEQLLSQQLTELEQELANHIILTQIKIKIEKTKERCISAERSILQNNLEMVTKELKDFEVLQTESATGSHSELTTINADANLLNQILKNVLNKLKAREKKLRLHLEEIRTKAATYDNEKQAASEYEKQTILLRKAKKEVAELTNLKWLQDAYFHRLKVDIAFSELSLSEVAVFLQEEKQSDSRFPLSTEKLNDTVQLFTKCSLSLDRWHSCINFSIQELFFNDAVSPVLKLSTSGLNDAKTLFVLFQSCNFLETVLKLMEEKTQSMKSLLQSQEEFNLALQHDVIASRLRAISLNSQLMAHSDPVQTRGFKAELNLEIRQFVCTKLNEFEEHTCINIPKILNESNKANLTSINLKIFGNEPYLSKLLASCVKLRKKNVKLTRRFAALLFRKSRLKAEKSESLNLLNTLIDEQKTLEKNVYKLNSKIALMSAIGDDQNIPLKDKNANNQLRQNELEVNISTVQFEMQKIKNALSCLNVEYNNVLQKCEHFETRLSTVENFGATSTTPFSVQQISSVLDVQHSLARQKYDLQKQVEQIAIRRNYFLKSLAISFNQVDVCQELTDDDLPTNDLMVEVSSLEKHVNVLRSKLLKRMTMQSGALQLATSSISTGVNQK